MEELATGCGDHVAKYVVRVRPAVRRRHRALPKRGSCVTDGHQSVSASKLGICVPIHTSTKCRGVKSRRRLDRDRPGRNVGISRMVFFQGIAAARAEQQARLSQYE